MGSHQWVKKCPYCGFEQMQVCSYNSLYFEAICPICGYEIYTKERIPNDHDVKLAKKALGKMNDEEIEKAMGLFWEDKLPFVARSKGSIRSKEQEDEGATRQQRPSDGNLTPL